MPDATTQKSHPMPRVPLQVAQIDKPWAERLKKDVEYFHTQTGMKFSVIGRLAINNARFWDSIERGGTISVEKADQVYAWMATQGYYFNS